MKKQLIILLAVFALLTFSACEKKEDIFITSQMSPDGNYILSLYQMGSPQWSFGSVSARLVLENSDGKIVDKADLSLANDGTGVFEGNIVQVTWLDDSVEILMRESDTTRQFTYTLSYSK